MHRSWNIRNGKMYKLKNWLIVHYKRQVLHNKWKLVVTTCYYFSCIRKHLIYCVSDDAGHRNTLNSRRMRLAVFHPQDSTSSDWSVYTNWCRWIDSHCNVSGYDNWYNWRAQSKGLICSHLLFTKSSNHFWTFGPVCTWIILKKG